MGSVAQGNTRPEIITTGSAYGDWLKCPRLRWLGWEVQNGTSTRGYQRRRLSLPLATGVWCHRIAQGLLTIAIGFDIGPLWSELIAECHPELADASESLPAPPYAIPVEQWIGQCVIGYRSEATRRGLELGLSLDGSLPEEQFVERTIQEQAALLEAFGWAYQRVRVPRLLEEYEIVSVEREEFTLLAADVGMQARCDAVLRRRIDGRLFVYNLKTASSPDYRWQAQWEVDQQLMTESLAVERRLGERVYGVVIDGFDKGPRVTVNASTLKEKPKSDDVKWEAQRSRLIYGYKCEDIPGRPTMYDYEGTTRKGWGKFAVWEEEFTGKFGSSEPVTGVSPVEYWVHWLPVEQVEAMFVTLPPIMRSDGKVQAKVEQIVEQERLMRSHRDVTEQHDLPEWRATALNHFWPQNEKSCIGFSKASRCQFYQVCHEGVNPAEDDRFMPRESNHPEVE